MAFGCCPCCQESPQPVLAYENITKVEGGATPYPRPIYECESGGTSCVPAEQAPASCGEAGQPRCAPWITYEDGERIVEDKDSCAAGQGQSVQEVDLNCYALTPTLTPGYPCRFMGFKNVQATKQWHGMFPFGDPCACPDERKTKYRTIQTKVILEQRYEDYIINPPPQDDHWRLEYNATSTVDRESGTVTVSPDTHAGRISYLGQINADGTQETIDGATFASQFCTALELGFVRWNCTWGGNRELIGGDPGCTADGKNIAGYLVELGNGGTVNSGCLDWEVLEKVESSTTCKISVRHTCESYVGEPPVLATSIFEVTVEHILSNPYTIDEVQDEVKEMLGYWDLSDDALYRWRTDEYLSIAPLVSRDEYSQRTPDVGMVAANFVNEDVRSGELLGLPAPAGFSGHFDFSHTNWVECCFDGNCSWCESSVGAFQGQANDGDASDEYVPDRATKWTEQFMGTLLRPGAWIEYPVKNDNGDPTPSLGVWAQKWAEVHVTFPKHNAARPCGKDRRQLDRTSARCVVSEPSPGQVELDSDSTIATGDWVVYGGEIYEVTKDSSVPPVYTLNTSKGPAPAWMDDSYGNFAKINRKSSLPTCGLVGVTSATDNGDGTVTVVFADEVYILPGESIAFTGVAGLTTNAVNTITSATEIVFDGALSETYDGGGTVGATNALNTDTPDRKFIHRIWEIDEDPAVETLTETQKTFTAAGRHPAVFCISPNGEVFENGETYVLPIPQDFHECHTTTWVSDVLQYEGDPYYQIPPDPCPTGALTADNGDCTGDYPHSLPHTADTTVFHSSSASPFPMGDGLTQETPWGLWLRMKACVDATGAFATDYATVTRYHKT